MRRKKDKKVRQEFSGIGAGGNRNCDPSSNHSPCNAGSESSADDVGQHHKLFSPNVKDYLIIFNFCSFFAKFVSFR